MPHIEILFKIFNKLFGRLQQVARLWVGDSARDLGVNGHCLSSGLQQQYVCSQNRHDMTESHCLTNDGSYLTEETDASDNGIENGFKERIVTWCEVSRCSDELLSPPHLRRIREIHC
ncbi:hypothetical protein TNCV_1476651 [Trichonephila clavipes]|nr:hypothetical protein TNCV_1476651 [Trichonephila clavipes]